MGHSRLAFPYQNPQLCRTEGVFCQVKLQASIIRPILSYSTGEPFFLRLPPLPPFFKVFFHHCLWVGHTLPSSDGGT